MGRGGVAQPLIWLTLKTRWVPRPLRTLQRACPERSRRGGYHERMRNGVLCRATRVVLAASQPALANNARAFTEPSRRVSPLLRDVGVVARDLRHPPKFSMGRLLANAGETNLLRSPERAVADFYCATLGTRALWRECNLDRAGLPNAQLFRTIIGFGKIADYLDG